MFRKLSVLALLLPSSLLVASCSSSSKTLEKIEKDETALVATVPFEPPLLYQKDQELVGPDAELAKRIVEQLGQVSIGPGQSPNIRLHWITRTHAALAPALENEEADLAIGVFGITEELKEHIQFSNPYYTSELVLIINPSNRDLRNTKQLAGTRVAVREGTAVQKFVEKEISGSKVVPFKTLDDAVLALKRAEVDAIIDDRYMAVFSLDTVPSATYLEIVPGVIGEIDVAVGLRKGDDRLFELVNKVTAEVKNENQYAKWLNEHDAARRAKVEARHAQRLERERKAKEPRRVDIRVTKDPGFEFDIYRMANLSFVLTNRETGQLYHSTRIDFQQRVGVSQATIPPGSYVLSLPKFGFSAPLNIETLDPRHVTVNIRIGTQIHVSKT